MRSNVALVGVDTYDGLLRWAIIVFLVAMVVVFFLHRKKLNSHRPWVAMMITVFVLAPILLMEFSVDKSETPVARKDDTPSKVEPEPNVDPEPEPEPQPEPEPEPQPEPDNYDKPDFVPEVPDSDDNRSSRDAIVPEVVPDGKSGHGGGEVAVVADYKVVHEKMNTDGKTYEIEKVETETAPEGAVVTPEVEEYEGFVAPEPKTVEVSANKIMTVEYRYAREECDLTVYNEKYVNGAKTGTYYYGTEFSLDAMERPGYDFTGWSDMTQSGQTAFTLKADKVIGPNYVPKSYQVAFHANHASATGEMEEAEFIYDREAELPENKFVVQGYYMRWNTQPDGKGDYYDDKQTVKNLSQGDKVDLYAIWIPRTDTPYRVIHKKMTTNGDYIGAEEEVEAFTGVTDKPVTPETKNYAGYETPEARTEIITGDGEMAVIYEYPRKKFTLSLGNRTHIVAADREKSGEYYHGEIIHLEAEESFDGAVFDKWNDGETARARDFAMPADDAIIAPLYAGEGDFPVVFEQVGQCEFHARFNDLTKIASSAGPMTGDDCLLYGDAAYIDTGIELFSEDNIGKDFLISFTIDEFDLSKNGYRPTLLNATLESSDYLYPGLVLRRNDASTNFFFGNDVVYYKSDGSLARDAKKFTNVAAGAKKVMIYRKAGKIYFKTTDDDGNWKAQSSLGNQNLSSDRTLFVHDTPLYFGASREKVNNVWKATKFMDAKMSDIVVRLGEDTEGLIPTN